LLEIPELAPNKLVWLSSIAQALAQVWEAAKLCYLSMPPWGEHFWLCWFQFWNRLCCCELGNLCATDVCMPWKANPACYSAYIKSDTQLLPLLLS